MTALGSELNPTALRVVGQLRFFSNGTNLVEGREMWSPQGVAVDLSSNPPHLYVADTLNNRVLGWRDAGRFSNGAMADLVIGQADFFGVSSNAPTVVLGLSQPWALAVDGAGNLWIADTGNHRVVRYPRPFDQRIQAPDFVIGQSSLAARDRNMGLAAPNEFTLASPLAVAVSGRGNLAVADTGNHRVLLFGANASAASAVLGQANFTETAFGAGPANMNAPSAVTFDAAGRLYVANLASNRVLQFPATVGTGTAPLRIIGGNAENAPRGPQTLLRPSGVALLGDDLFVADTGNHRVLRFSGFARLPEPRPIADAVFGQADFASAIANGGSRVLPMASAQSLSLPGQIAFGPNLELLVADAGNHRVLAISPNSGRYVEAAGVLGQDNFTHNAPNLVEGREASTANLLTTPLGLLTAAGGVVVDTTSSPPRVYIADTGNHRVLGWRDARSLREGMHADLVIGQPDFLTAISNYGTAAAENRPAGPSTLSRPSGLALDEAGNLYVADTGNHRVMRFPRPFEQATPVRSDLVIGLAAEGTSAYLLNRPTGIAVHRERGDLLVADTMNHRVLYFAGPLSSGMPATRVFGQLSFGESARGLSSAAMTLPTGVAFDSDDDIYVADTGNSRVLVFGPLRDLPAAGAAALASGGAPIGQPDFVTGAGGTATNRLRNPTAVWVDQGNSEIWVADTGNHRVLRFPPLGALALNGGAAYSSGGLFGQVSFTGRTPNMGAAAAGQTSAMGLSSPNAVALDAAGNLLIGDGNARVLLYFPQATSVSAATYLVGAPLAPGMLVSLFGAELSEETAVAGLPLPTALGDTQVLVEGTPVPLSYVSPRQINYQAPSSLSPGMLARVEVTRASTGRAVAGGAILAAPAAAGIFGVLNEDGSANSPANPAARGSVLQIFATGQGAVLHPPVDGTPAAAAPISETPSRPLVTIGTSSERDVAAEFSGLAPGFVGLWQINARVPAATVPGPRTPVVVRYAGSASNVVFIAVR